MILRTSLICAFFISSVGFAVTESDIQNAETQFTNNMSNLDKVKNHLSAIANDSGLPPIDGAGDASNNPPAPWYGEPEAWTDLVVALKTLDVVSNNVQTAIPKLKIVLPFFDIFVIRHTALCSQLTQVNTAWTSLEFADFATLPFHQRLGSQFYQDARAVVNVTRGFGGLQCP